MTLFTGHENNPSLNLINQERVGFYIVHYILGSQTDALAGNKVFVWKHTIENILQGFCILILLEGVPL